MIPESIWPGMFQAEALPTSGEKTRSAKSDQSDFDQGRLSVIWVWAVWHVQLIR